MHILVLCIYMLCAYFYDFYKLNELFTISLCSTYYSIVLLQDTTNTRKQKHP